MYGFVSCIFSRCKERIVVCMDLIVVVEPIKPPFELEEYAIVSWVVQISGLGVD